MKTTSEACEFGEGNGEDHRFGELDTIAIQAMWRKAEERQTHCIVDGQPLTVDEFEIAHPNIMLSTT